MTKVHLSKTAGIPLKYANRHGLITGQTGTGKTVTLMKLAEQFSKAGVPSFISDVKGDIGALFRSCPVELLDLFGIAGKPIKVTIAAMGADLLSRSLELSDVQSATVEIAFAYAKARGIQINTVAEFRDLLALLVADRESVSIEFGQLSSASVGVVQRQLLRLQTQGANQFFGSPAFDVADLLTESRVSILAADQLMNSPRLYSAFLLFMLSDLYNRLPEIGDLEKPRLVFFFDEAHLLFADCPAFLLRRIEQIVRLIRSKGVGVYFVTQSPADVPDVIKEQLAHRVEHDRSMNIGTAKLATMDDNGRPLPMVTIAVDLPTCQLGALSDIERRAAIGDSLPVPSTTAGTPASTATPWRVEVGTASALGHNEGIALAVVLVPVLMAVAFWLGSYLT